MLKKYKSAAKLQARPNHKNYLKELRTSKLIKREKQGWENILENKEIEKVQDRYEIMKAELEKKDVELGLAEEIRRQGADQGRKKEY